MNNTKPDNTSNNIDDNATARILESMNERQSALLNESFDNQRDPIEKAALLAIAQQRHEQAVKRNRRINGKVAVVNRIRGNHVQLQKKESAIKGYKIVNGQAVKMTFKEMKKRRVSAKIAAKKRRNEMAVINRKRAISMKLRARRLGY